jgi:hypothetical protein
VLANEKATTAEINAAKVNIINAWNKLKKFAYVKITSFDFPDPNDFDAQNLDKTKLIKV